MKCPYCNEEMIRGYIYGYRYTLKWLPEEKDLLFGMWAKDSIKIGESEEMGRPRVEAHMCSECGKYIIDIGGKKNRKTD